MFNELKHLQKMGCNESGPPEKYSERDLSAVHDAMRQLELTIGEGNVKAVWDALPYNLKFDYNWSFWKYHKRKL